MKALWQRRKIIVVCLFLLILPVVFLSGLEKTAGKENKQPADRVIIYMIDKLSIDDVDPNLTPYLWSLTEQAGMGLLNPVSAGERTIKNVCCTISAGDLSVSSHKAQLNFKADELINSESAADIFFRNTAILPEINNIVITNKTTIFKNNETRALAKPGKLGDSLHGLGITAALIGDSDRPSYYSRAGALILMDSNGLVDDGVLGSEVHQTDRDGILPFQSDYSEILAQAKRLQENRVILIEFGDLNRLESMNSLFSSARYKEKRKKILSSIDDSIRNIQNELASEHSCAYIINPAPSRSSLSGDNLLTPLIVIKPGFNGILSSYSTRREGIVSSISIKNSILNCFDSEKQDSIYAQNKQASYQFLQDLRQRATFTYLNQEMILTAHGILLLLLLLVSFILFIRKNQQNLIDFIMVLILSFPLSFLLISQIEIFNPAFYIMISILSNLLIAALCQGTARVSKTHPLLIILILTVAVIVVDLLSNTTLISNSIMSYQIIRGARYYGLGNEYLGVLLGAAISTAALLLQKHFSRRRLFFTALLFTLLTFVVAYPRLGINVGGTIITCIALGYAFSRFSNLDMKVSGLLLLVLGTVATIAIMIIIDLKQPVQLQSHLGHGFSLILNGGFQDFVPIIYRKIQMHLQIISSTIWSWIFLLSLLLCIYLFFKPSNHATILMSPIPVDENYKGLQSILLAAIAAIIFNDSGIVTAAILSIYFLVLLLHSLCEQRNNSSA